MRSHLARAALGLAAVSVAVGCSRAEDPPGRTTAAHVAGSLAAPSAAASASQPEPASALPGSGAKIASIAMRTWVYVAPDDRSTKLGYLRAGAVVDRAEQPAGFAGCTGGWYRVVPRGYVCVGKGATLSLEHQIVQAAVRGPARGAPLPYGYVMSRHPPPPLYFRLPTREEQERVEGGTLGTNVATYAATDVAESSKADAVPPFLLDGRDLPKPYGAEEKLHFAVHAGRAKDSSAFGLITAFEWTGRMFGLTTELDLIPLDRTRRAPASSFHGIAIDKEGTPAFVVRGGASKYRADARGALHEDGMAEGRSGWILTGRNNGSDRGLLETTEGVWLPAEGLVIAEPREDPAGFARANRRWIDVSIRKQLLVAYEGKRAAYATLVSTGIGVMGDPETTHATVRGTFMIHAKHVSATMDGDDEATDAFDLRDVPYVQYFFQGYALHAAYWHDDFGKARSHGCVNLAPADAAWLFDWTDPAVPPEWHGAVNMESGTLVYVHG